MYRIQLKFKLRNKYKDFALCFKNNINESIESRHRADI